MTHVHRHALVRQTPQQMFDLVNDVEAYPARFAWCANAKVLERDDTHVVARLDLRFAGVVRHFVTRNAIERPSRIAMQFVEGPFRSLSGEWTFHTLGGKAPSSGSAGHPGSSPGQALLPQAGQGETEQPAATNTSAGCKVELTLDFEVANWLTGVALRVGFQKLADQMVDDFVAESNKSCA
ncbi:MAG: type II toxin-antitoxin system RatA family toxin [Rhodanobacteraceae bacterium]